MTAKKEYPLSHRETIKALVKDPEYLKEIVKMFFWILFIIFILYLVTKL